MNCLFIIAHNGFQDHEFREPYQKLLTAGYEVIIASSQTGTCIGKFGIHTAIATLTINEVRPELFDLIVLIGGPGAGAEFTNNDTYGRIAQQAKHLAAICIAPSIIAPYGVLRGKKCTGRDDGLGTQINIITDNGGLYQQQDVVIDDNLITANGPHAAKVFANAILKVRNS